MDKSDTLPCMKSLRDSFCLLLCQLRDEAPLQEMRGAPTKSEKMDDEEN